MIVNKVKHFNSSLPLLFRIMNNDDGLIVTSPIFLLTSTQACNLCGKENSIAAIATLNLSDPGDESFTQNMAGEGFLLTDVESLPDDLLAAILEYHPNYRLEFSSTMGYDYYMSVCGCGAHYGDHFVHQQLLDLAFREPSKLGIEKLPINGAFQISCGWSSSSSVTDLLRKVLEVPTISDQIYHAGYQDCIKKREGEYHNPYSLYSDEFNLYERGWSQAAKSFDGNFPRVSPGESEIIYRLDMSKFKK